MQIGVGLVKSKDHAHEASKWMNNWRSSLFSIPYNTIQTHY